MKELEKFLERELNGLALKKADWGHLTIEDDSRERTLIEVQGLVKKLPIHNVSKRCFCGADFDGIECNSCGFDASEVDIY
jgi:hypothetical protein